MLCALVLAAGRSRRMGQPKLLLPLNGEPVLRRVLRAFRQSPIDHLAIVVGQDDPDLIAAVQDDRIQWVQNPEPDSEMLASIRCGLRALPPHWSAVLITPADQPGLDADTVSTLIEAHRQTASSLIVPVFNGRRGHPVLVGRTHADAILGRFDGVGLRGLFRENAAKVLELPCDSPNVIEDLDTPEDYLRWQERIGDR